MFALFDYNPYYGRAEKSQAAKRREEVAVAKFDAIRERVHYAALNNKFHVVKLGHGDDGSPLSLVPDVALDHIFGFIKSAGFDDHVRGPPVRVSKQKPVPFDSAVASTTTTKTTTEKLVDATSKDDIPFDINALHEPGRKHIIRLLNPNEHLTGKFL